MNQTLRREANRIIEEAIHSVKPEEAVKRALDGKHFKGEFMWYRWEKPDIPWRRQLLLCWILKKEL